MRRYEECREQRGGRGDRRPMFKPRDQVCALQPHSDKTTPPVLRAEVQVEGGGGGAAKIGPCYRCGQMGHLANACTNTCLNAMHSNEDDVNKPSPAEEEVQDVPEPESRRTDERREEAEASSDNDAYFAEMYERYGYLDSDNKSVVNDEDSEDGGAHLSAMRTGVALDKKATEDRTFCLGIHCIEPRKEYPPKDWECLAAFERSRCSIRVRTWTR
jgi:hypothetical protein